MPLQLQLICLLEFIFLLLLPLETTSSITRKPDCLNGCGDVSIPYPFGVGSDCSLDASFNIICNTSTIPHKPYLKIDGESVEVVEIRVDNPPQIRIKYPHLLSGACYDKTSGNETWRDVNDISLSETQYTVSEENWLTAIGCDDLMAANTYIGDQRFRDACLGICMNENYSVNGACPNNEDGNSGGDGCCRIPIPKGSDYVSANLIGLSKSWESERVYPCSYAFVMEKGISNKTGFSYNFSLLRENPTADMSGNPTVVRLDWRIGAENCSQAQRNSTFACQGNNNVCVDFGHNVQGYLCNCSQGYVGNPYLYQGCQGLVCTRCTSDGQRVDRIIAR